MLNSERKRRRTKEKKSKKLPKKVTLYFNKYDEIVEERVVQADRHHYYHKYHSVDVDFGGEDSVKDLLTQDIFWGQGKAENVQIFIENYEKSKAKHQKKIMERDLYQSFESEEPEKGEGKSQNGELQ